MHTKLKGHLVQPTNQKSKYCPNWVAQLVGASTYIYTISQVGVCKRGNRIDVFLSLPSFLLKRIKSISWVRIKKKSKYWFKTFSCWEFIASERNMSNPSPRDSLWWTREQCGTFFDRPAIQVLEDSYDISHNSFVNWDKHLHLILYIIV